MFDEICLGKIIYDVLMNKINLSKEELDFIIDERSKKISKTIEGIIEFIINEKKEKIWVIQNKSDLLYFIKKEVPRKFTHTNKIIEELMPKSIEQNHYRESLSKIPLDMYVNISREYLLIGRTKTKKSLIEKVVLKKAINLKAELEEEIKKIKKFGILIAMSNIAYNSVKNTLKNYKNNLILLTELKDSLRKKERFWKKLRFRYLSPFIFVSEKERVEELVFEDKKNKEKMKLEIVEIKDFSRIEEEIANYLIKKKNEIFDEEIEIKDMGGLNFVLIQSKDLKSEIGQVGQVCSSIIFKKVFPALNKTTGNKAKIYRIKDYLEEHPRKYRAIHYLIKLEKGKKIRIFFPDILEIKITLSFEDFIRNEYGEAYHLGHKIKTRKKAKIPKELEERIRKYFPYLL